MSSHHQPTGWPCESANSPKGFILLVEDNQDLRELLIEYLVRMGHSVCAVATACQALALIQQGIQARVVITDLIMPQMNGDEFAMHVRQIRPEIKFLFTSGYPIKPPANDSFLAKPFSLTQLGQEVRALLLSI